MAINIFEKYGIKEVANVQFEALAAEPKNNVKEGDIVLFLDTLKVSTIEQTAENTDARGGWGNPRLVTWDYGKDINLTLTDALISMESLRFMLGGQLKEASTTSKIAVHLTEEGVVKTANTVPEIKHHLTGTTLTLPADYRYINMTTGKRGTVGGEDSATFEAAVGDHVRFFWTEEVDGEDAQKSAVEITISPNTFPGTYKVVGETFMRSSETGKDEAFQFIINKAKVLSSVTLTLEAEGDPSTFDMTLNVLRSKNDAGEDEMMKLVRYNI